jgi:hypothetical protein
MQYTIAYNSRISVQQRWGVKVLRVRGEGIARGDPAALLLSRYG